LTLINLATWQLTGRFTAAAPGTTEFLGDALNALGRNKDTVRETGILALLFGIAWKLLLVVALIWLTVWFMKKFLRLSPEGRSPEGAVRVLSVTHLDPRHSIYLVEVGERLLVLGAGAESLGLLAEIATPVERNAIKERLKEPGAGFGSYLSEWASRMASGGGPKEQLKEGADFLRRQLDELRRKRGGGGAP
jgi:flagellar biosynthetic protein FliO